MSSNDSSQLLVDVEAIIEQLKVYDDEYFAAGDSLVSDAEYDALKKTAKALDPTNTYFNQVGSDVRGGKIRLPHTMGSLDQIYQNEVEAWVKKYNLHDETIVVTDKLDGISCMLVYKNYRLSIAYSRGNGTEGADITRHIRQIPCVPKQIPFRNLTVRGELIMENDTFGIRDYIKKYKNPRAMVAGCTNRSVTEAAVLSDIHFVTYEIVEHSDDMDSFVNDKLSSLDTLKSAGFMVVTAIKTKGKSLDDAFLTDRIHTARAASPYDLDGVVATINRYNHTQSQRQALSLNPEDSIKYKITDAASVVLTTVTDVLYEVSKSAWWKPRVQIVPVDLFGTTVTYASGFNARFIHDNGIGPGAIVQITKAGTVIPYIVSVQKKVAPKMPQGSWKWNDNGVEAVATDAATLEQVKFKSVLDFVETIEVDGLRESTLRDVFTKFNMFNNSYSYEDILWALFDMSDVEWAKAVGQNGYKIYNSMQRRLANMKVETFIGATNYMGVGFGVRKTTTLLEQIDLSAVLQASVDDIRQLNGFDTTTAQQVVNGFPKALDLLNDLIKANIVTLVKETKSDEMKGLNVVFTGFRDSEMEKTIVKMGGKVGSSVSGKTTHLLAVAHDTGSAKYKKAKELKVLTMTADEFKDKYNI
jgi:NAD-dependent DNA ligase